MILADADEFILVAGGGPGGPEDHAAFGDHEEHLALLLPEEDEAVLREAGSRGVGLFDAWFAFRGWVACA